MMKKQKAPEMKKHRKVCSKGDIAFNIVNYTVFFLITLACVFPFYYLFINTISNNDLVGKNMITLIPQGIHFSNYLALKDVNDFGNAVLVTVSRTLLGTTLMVLVSAFAGMDTIRRAYAHAIAERYRFFSYGDAMFLTRTPA